MIDVSSHQLEIIKKALKKYVPGCEVRVFGSRATWTAKDYSDLDLVIVGAERLSDDIVFSLKEVFQESDLPFRVDVLDWNSISDEFRNVINKGYEVLQKSKTKFKETEIGKIPGDWDIQKIKDLGKVITGKTPPTKESKYFGKDYPFIKIPDMGICVRVENSETMLSHEGAQYMYNLKLPPDSVMVSCLATIGKVGITAKESFTNQQINSVVPNNNKVIPEWIYYYFKDNTKYLKSLGGGGSVYTNISKSRFESAKIILPPITEQRAIAKILSDLDAKIELNLEMNKTLEAIGQALFERWFIDYEFPMEIYSQPSPRPSPRGRGSDGKGGLGYKSLCGEMVDSELGEMPNGWEVGKFCNIVTNIKEALKPGNHLSDRRYVPIDSLPMKHIGMIEDKPSVKAKSSLIAFEKNDILFGAMRAYFHRVNFAPFKGVTRTTTFVLRPNKEHYLSYGLFLLNQDSSVDYANLHSKGSTMPYTVWDNSLAEMPVFVPGEVTLKAYHDLIYPLLQRIAEISDENKKLSSIRDSLLPRLMSGKIRVGMNL